MATGEKEIAALKATQAKAAEADSEESTNDEETTGGVEVEESTDETTTSGDEATETDEETAKEDEDESKEESKDSEDEFTPRFTQFKAETLDDYTKQLESAFANSSTEGQRLAGEVKDLQTKLQAIATAAQADPALAESLDKATDGNVTGPLNPALAKLQQDYDKKQETDFNDFMAKNREINDDPALASKFLETVKGVAQTVWITQKRQVEMSEALQMASAILGVGNSTDDAVKQAVKQTAALSKTTSSKKAAPQSDLTDAQIRIAQRFGVSEKSLQKYATK